MNGRDNFRREFRFQNLPALAGDAKRRAEDSLGRRRAKTNQQSRPNDSKLGLEPRPAGRDLARVRLLVDPAFAARLPLEVLHRVRDVNLAAIDPGFFEGAIQNLARWPDERFPREIFLIARFFAEQHQLRAFRALAEHGLGGVSKKMAG